MKKIVELKQGKENIALLLKELSERTTKKGSPFLILTLTDGKDDINAKKWDMSKKDFPYEIGTVLECNMNVSTYSDDVWDLRPFITVKSIKESHKYIRFEYIADADIKETVKQYAYYKLGKIKPQTVMYYINGKLPMFVEYCSINGIHGFAAVTLEDYLNFNLWMKDEKKVASNTGNGSCHVVEEIIQIGQIKGWNVPQFHLSKTETANQLWDRRKSMRSNKTKPIPGWTFHRENCKNSQS